MMAAAAANNAHRVFVYGTLKRGFYNHQLLQKHGATFVAPAKTSRAFPLTLGKYNIPYLIDSPGDGGRLKGELYEVSRCKLNTSA